MTDSLTVRKIGDSLGVLLPKVELDRLSAGEFEDDKLARWIERNSRKIKGGRLS